MVKTKIFFWILFFVYLIGIVSAQEQLCVSSDGLDYNVKGTLTNYKGESSEETCLEREGSLGNRMDYAEKGRFLTETFCTDNLPDSHIYECENLCVNGACVPLDESSIMNAQGGYKIYTKEGTYTIKRGDVIKINNIEGQVGSFGVDYENNKLITISYDTASVLSLKENEKGYFFYGSVVRPASKNLQMIVNKIDEDSAKVTFIEVNEEIYYPGPIDNVIAKTWMANPYDEPLSCEEICKTYKSEVIINGCLDTSLNACTVAYGTACKSSNPKQIIKKYDGNLCCCKIGNVKYTYTESNQQNDCTSSDGNNPFAKGRTVDVRTDTIYEDKCEGEGVIDYSCDSFGQVVFFSDPIKCPFGCEDGACIKCPSPGDMGDGTYCSEDGPVLKKKEKESYCKYSYECKGSCKENKCMGVFGRIISWFKNLF